MWGVSASVPATRSRNAKTFPFFGVPVAELWNPYCRWWGGGAGPLPRGVRPPPYRATAPMPRPPLFMGELRPTPGRISRGRSHRVALEPARHPPPLLVARNFPGVSTAAISDFRKLARRRRGPYPGVGWSDSADLCQPAPACRFPRDSFGRAGRRDGPARLSANLCELGALLGARFGEPGPVQLLVLDAVVGAEPLLSGTAYLPGAQEVESRARRRAWVSGSVSSEHRRPATIPYLWASR